MMKLKLYLMSFLLLCGLALGAPAGNISVDEVFSTLHTQMQNLRSLDMRTVVITNSPHSRGKTPGKIALNQQQSSLDLSEDTREYLRKLDREGSIERRESHFRREGNKYAASMDYKQWTGSFDDFESRPPLREYDIARAFNGEKYQISRLGWMRVSSKNQFTTEHTSDPDFIEAFRFTFTAKTPGRVSLDWLRTKEAWEQLKEHAVIVGRQKVGEHQCVVVELVIPNLNARGKLITRRVYLGEDLEFFPVRYESMLGKERTMVRQFEVENIRRVLETVKFWTVVNDGSLRNNGKEFLLSQPLCGKDLSEALESIDKYLTKIKAEVNDRTGLHIHLDVRKKKVGEVRNLVLLLVSLERILIKVSGDRADSNFCVPTSNCHKSIADFGSLFFNNSDHMYHSVRYAEKYSVLNIKNMCKLGSLEIRCHEGTYKKEALIRWIEIIYKIEKFSMLSKESGQNLLEMISMLGAERVLINIFGEHFYFSNIVYEGIDQDLFDGLGIAQDVVHAESMAKQRIPKRTRKYGTDEDEHLKLQRRVEKVVRSGKKKKKDINKVEFNVEGYDDFVAQVAAHPAHALPHALIPRERVQEAWDRMQREGIEGAVEEAPGLEDPPLEPDDEEAPAVPEALPLERIHLDALNAIMNRAQARLRENHDEDELLVDEDGLPVDG